MSDRLEDIEWGSQRHFEALHAFIHLAEGECQQVGLQALVGSPDAEIIGLYDSYIKCVMSWRYRNKWLQIINFAAIKPRQGYGGQFFKLFSTDLNVWLKCLPDTLPFWKKMGFEAIGPANGGMTVCVR